MASRQKILPMDARVPKNPKYEHITPTIDTGASMTKHLARLEDIRTNYRYRPGEIFRRMKATTLVTLMLPVLENQQALAAWKAREAEEHHRYEQYLAAITPTSPFARFTSGLGEVPNSEPRPTSARAPIITQRPPFPMECMQILLLDVRDKYDFATCHIYGALNYPATMLSRACNYFTPEIMEFANKPDRFVVLYDEDERVASSAATTFVQRGVDNVFMLSGGLKVFYQRFPASGIIRGSIPASIKPAPTSTKPKAATPRPTSARPLAEVNSARPLTSQAPMTPSMSSTVSSSGLVDSTPLTTEALATLHEELQRSQAIDAGVLMPPATPRVATARSARATTATSARSARPASASANHWVP